MTMRLSDTVVLGNTGIRVSRVGFGVHPLGPSRMNLSLPDGAELMLYAYRNGIRFFDTAQFYRTYHYVKAALERIRADDAFEEVPVISGKSLAESYEDMTEAIDEALRETGLDRLDLFLMHQVAADYGEEREGAKKALLDARKQGKIRAAGSSTHHQDAAAFAAADPELDVVFALYNYTGLGIRCGDAPGSAAGMLSALKSCRAAGKGVYTMKVFGGGNLTRDYQTAVRHVFSDCADTIEAAVIGFTSKREIDELGLLMTGEMEAAYNPPTDHKRLRIDRGDCMGCGTCVRICASGAMHYSREDGLAEIDYEKCVSCHYCAIACPERAIVFW